MIALARRSPLAALLATTAVLLGGCHGATDPPDPTPTDPPAGCTSCSGAVAWAKAFPVQGNRSGGVAMAATPDGGVILTGGLIDGMDLGAGPMTTAGDQDVFVAKIDGTGALSWVKSFGSPGGIKPRASRSTRKETSSSAVSSPGRSTSAADRAARPVRAGCSS